MTYKEVYLMKNVSIEAKAIYGMLCSYAGSGAEAYPSVDLICNALDISRTRFYKHMNQLVKEGVIVKNQKKTKNNAFSNNVYILIPNLNGQNLPCTYFPHTGNEHTGNEHTGNPYTEDLTTNNNILNNNRVNNNRVNTMCKADASALFERLWKAYPNKRGKGKVSDAQKKKLLEIGEEHMKRAIDRYLHDLNQEEWRKPQNGSTFFNSGYVDYLDENYVLPDQRPPAKPPDQPRKNAFHNFEQRDYDYDDLERKLLDKR